MPDAAMPSIAELRAFALTRSLGTKTDLKSAIHSLGYVQADPIRAPARAQDLILMQRVRGYKVGDLERHYAELGIEEDVLHNYGFIPRELQRLLHPRQQEPPKVGNQVPSLSERVLAYVREHEGVHPRDLDAHFGQNVVGNAWGGTSSATTQALDALHYLGKLRIVRRDKGTRVYGVAHHLQTENQAPHIKTLSQQEQALGLVQLLLKLYAPLPAPSLGYLISLLRYGAPHLKAELQVAFKNIEAQRAKVDGLTYLWPEGETMEVEEPIARKVRLLTPFDPVVWDRRRFAHLHGWAYKFEAYTPAAKRQFGYYALPLLWGAEAIGWANLKVDGVELRAEVGFINNVPKSKLFARELEAELNLYCAFLGCVS